MKITEPILTICITAYNNVDNIGRALDSILTQETEYLYEIVVHDDASSDGTVDILKSYRKRYPDRIVLVLEEKNVWTLGQINVIHALESYFNREYIQFMDGDDYWCSKEKIQKQVSFLEENKDAIGVTHRSKAVKETNNGESVIVGYSPSKKNNDVWTIDEIIDWRDASHTSSLMFRTRYLNMMPDSLYDILAFDWARFVWLCSKGNVYYLNDIMTTIVTGNPNGYGVMNWKDGIYHNYESTLKKRQKWCDILDKSTDYKYHDVFVYSQNRRLADYLWDMGKHKEALRVKGYYKNKPIRKKIIMLLVAYIPGFAKLYRLIVYKKNVI